MCQTLEHEKVEVGRKVDEEGRRISSGCVEHGSFFHLVVKLEFDVLLVFTIESKDDTNVVVEAGLSHVCDEDGRGMRKGEGKFFRSQRMSQRDG